MFTDMVGYTALVQRNEPLSLALVEEQKKLIRPILGRHSGKEIKTMGDAFLVEFPSALDAVRCAYDIQRATREFNISLPDEKRIHLRVGVHLGDVVESRGDISGDAVNVASRIESLAEDGGVCITRQVYDHVLNKFELPLVSLGPKTLKNVSALVEVYKMVMPWEEERAAPRPILDKRRIAVLPFTNISPDPADEYFADGMTEELISTMSRISGMKVIARTSIMGYKGGHKRVDEVARELGVGTVLEGSVRKAGNRIRITAQLIDSETSEHMCAESYDRELEDVFAIQTGVAENVSHALETQLLGEERERIEKKPTGDISAYTFYLKGRYYWNERNKESLEKSIKYFEEAIRRDNRFALAYAGMADCYAVLADYGYYATDAMSKAKELAVKALSIDDSLAEAHASLGSVLHQFWEWEKAETEYKRAIDLTPNYATAHHWYAYLLFRVGRIRDAAVEAKRALELDPLSPMINVVSTGPDYIMGNYDQAIVGLRRTIEMAPDFPMAHYWLAHGLVEKGSLEDAVSEMRRAVELTHGATFARAGLAYALAKAGQKDEAIRIVGELTKGEEYTDAADIAMVFAGLRQRETALDWLEKAYEMRSSGITNIGWVGWYREFHSDERFLRLVDRMRIRIPAGL